jgi:hypothetical protein
MHMAVPLVITGLLAATGADKYDLDWVKADAGDNPFVIRADIVIDAPIDVVWALVRNPNGYETFNRRIAAHADRVEVGQPIALEIRLLGENSAPTTSNEKIVIVDDELHVASWDRDFGFGQITHRPQLLEAEGNRTHYYTALWLPKSFGWLVVATFGKHIQSAFADFARGLKTAAEAAR